MTTGLIDLIAPFARRRAVELAPNWYADADAAAGGHDGVYDGPDGLEKMCAALGWDKPEALTHRPRPNEFPMLAYRDGQGWAIAEQWDTTDQVRVSNQIGHGVWPADEATHFYAFNLPDPFRPTNDEKAVNIFWRAIRRRKGALVAAVVATVMANFITLATSLYSMQVYDRVIPRGSYATLWVLTVGVLFALLIDFILRTTRALLIEREAARIDTETSEFFFARAQSVRLDARPPGVGTMAAQLRGLEQIRSFLSSGTIFLVADLPFALFFIVIIFALGGIIAVVPVIFFPLSLLLAFFFARMIRSATDRAQVSGNRKNGLLVETLDAAETVKANRGGWHMLARWNRLMDEVHENEDPVKRWSSTAGAIFSTLQQVAYVGIIAFGAIEVAEGNMTTGALIACSIIAGRINGPLITQLPGLIVQWGYARSSLKALDSIMVLPPDQPADVASLRPEALPGPLKLERIQFAYPGARTGIDIARLEIKPGERVGLIGGIGSGKSTLLRLMAGLYAPQQGTVTIGGLDTANLAGDVLRNHVGYLPQDFRLINGTLRDNLLLGIPDPGDDAIIAASDKTGLSQLIAGHPKGLDLPIAEGGRGLSGGQRTLAGLTRLMLIEPKLWLLDEPTANLDQQTEATVLNALSARMGAESTFVLVTHKLALLSLVSRVIVLGQGKVLLDGTTQEVLQRLQSASTRVTANPTTPPASAARPITAGGTA